MANQDDEILEVSPVIKKAINKILKPKLIGVEVMGRINVIEISKVVEINNIICKSKLILSSGFKNLCACINTKLQSYEPHQ